MKKILSLVLVALLLFSLTSCEDEPDAYSMLNQFIALYSAEGVIYSPTVPEGEVGYLRPDAFFSIYVYYGQEPKNYAVFLNSHVDFGSECGVFVTKSDRELAALMEACLERIRLLVGDGGGIVISCRGVLFYSTMSEPNFVESCWNRVLRSI
ncbi:MAG: hypothetical protein J6Q85_06600 [Clostridia bacterium]|nr:hypothetical protein [Clostridia bacterium]